MESYLFGGKEFERLYNCSVYDIDDVPFENRLHPVVGWALMALFVVFEAAYIPCIPAIRAHLNDSASYKFMYFISFCDVICLFVNSFATGLFSLLGTVYCSCPNLMYLVGALGTSLWYCESTAALLLAFNRCVDMWSPKLGDTLFAGRKTWIWLIVPTLYSLAMCWWNIPVLYNGVYGAWLFNPHAGYLDNVNELYENPFHAVHNLAVAAAFPTLYVVFLVLIMLNTTSVPRAVVTAPRWSWQTAVTMPPKIAKQTVAQGKGDEGEGGAARDGAQPGVEAMDTGATATAQQDAERKIAELEQQLHEAIHKLQQAEKSNADLEQQLIETDDNLNKMKASKDKLEKLLEAQLKKHNGETTGRRESLEDRLQTLGLVGGQQVINEGFSVTTPYAVTNRFV